MRFFSSRVKDLHSVLQCVFYILTQDSIDTGENDFNFVATEKPIDDVHHDDNSGTVYKDKTTSFFAQPGILAGKLLYIHLLRI